MCMHADINSVEKHHNPLYSITILHTAMLPCEAIWPFGYLRQQRTMTCPVAQVSGHDERLHAAAHKNIEQNLVPQCLIE